MSVWFKIEHTSAVPNNNNNNNIKKSSIEWSYVRCQKIEEISRSIGSPAVHTFSRDLTKESTNKLYGFQSKWFTE